MKLSDNCLRVLVFFMPFYLSIECGYVSLHVGLNGDSVSMTWFLRILVGLLVSGILLQYCTWLLPLAASLGYLQVLRCMVAVGVDARCANDLALRKSAAKGHVKVVKYLVSLGADPKADDDFALRASARNGHLKTVKYLVYVGANAHSYGDYALRACASTGQLEMVQYLLSLNNDTNVMNAALVNAASGGMLHIVQHLTLAGANPNAYDYAALHSAILAGHADVVKFLLALPDVNIHHVSVSAALIFAANANHVEVTELLLKKGADVHIRDDILLRDASARGQVGLVKLLLSYKAGVHVHDDVPLRVSAVKGHLQVVKLLLSHGANIHARCDAALRASAGIGHLKMVEYLLSQGADVDAVHCQALWLSADAGHDDVVQLLQAHINRTAATSKSTNSPSGGLCNSTLSRNGPADVIVDTAPAVIDNADKDAPATTTASNL